jgi:adenylate cyclase
MVDGEGRPGAGAETAAHIRTFLIADVRGYTVFTQERGDEAAAQLADRFASVSRGILEARGGTHLELRGDEVMAVFESARQAIRAAVELQRRFVDATIADPTLPLPVGIGLDAGEAVAVDDGYRGGALNLSPRRPRSWPARRSPTWRGRSRASRTWIGGPSGSRASRIPCR